MQPGRDLPPFSVLEAQSAPFKELSLDLSQAEVDQEQRETPHESEDRIDDAVGNRSVQSDPSSTRFSRLSILIDEFLAEVWGPRNREDQGEGELHSCG